MLFNCLLSSALAGSPNEITIRNSAIKVLASLYPFLGDSLYQLLSSVSHFSRTEHHDRYNFIRGSPLLLSLQQPSVLERVYCFVQEHPDLVHPIISPEEQHNWTDRAILHVNGPHGGDSSQVDNETEDQGTTNCTTDRRIFPSDHLSRAEDDPIIYNELGIGIVSCHRRRHHSLSSSVHESSLQFSCDLTFIALIIGWSREV